MNGRLLNGRLSGVICIILLSICPSAFALTPDDEPLAVIDGAQITVRAFKAEMERRGHALPGSFANPEQKEALLTEMARSEEMYASALKEGYDKRPEVVEALKRLVISRYRENNLEPELAKITATEDEIKAYYSQHPTDFATPQMVRAAVIKITIPKMISDEKKAELLKRAEAARGEAMKLDTSILSFGGVAVKYSDDQVSRYRGGDTGLMKRDEGNSRWDKEVMDTIFSLKKPGEISPVIATAGAYYLVKLAETKESVIRPLAEVKGMVSDQILHEKRNRTEREFFDKLGEQVKVRLNTDLLKIIQPAEAIRMGPPPLPGR